MNSLIVEKTNSLHTMDFSLVSLRYRRLFQNMFVPIEIKKNGLKFVDYRILDKDKQLLIWQARRKGAYSNGAYGAYSLGIPPEICRQPECSV